MAQRPRDSDRRQDGNDVSAKLLVGSPGRSGHRCHLDVFGNDG